MLSYNPIRRDVNKNYSISPVQIFFSILRNFESISFDRVRFIADKKHSKGYEPTPADYGLVIGGEDIAAVARQASKIAEVYSLPKEAMPNSAENIRDEVISKPKNSAQTTKDGKDEKQSYGRYNKLYDKIYGAVYRSKSKLNDYVDSLANVFKKLRSIYQGTSNFDVKKQPYNSFRKSGLDGKVIKISRYLSRKPNYQTKGKDYARMVPAPYNNKDESLEEKLAT